jgi:prepilin-type processing-associated H-X9-DG protein
MKWMILVTLLAATVVSPAAADGNLEEHLLGFKPLLAKRWIGHYSPDSEGLTHLLSVEVILSGRAIRLSKEVPEIGYSSEMLIFWNPATSTVELLSLTSNGHVNRGTVLFTDGSVELHMWKDGRTETPQTRLVFKLGTDGSLYDEFFRQTTDGWQLGHLVIYNREEPDL